MAQLENISVAKIQIASNCKREEKVFDEGALKDSIKADDLLQSVLVNKTDGKYELICGIRRFEIAKTLGHKTVPVIVKENLSETDKLAFRLAENSARVGISDAEKGHLIIKAYKAAGFGLEESKKYLEAIHGTQHQGSTPRQKTPASFLALSKQMGLNAGHQAKYIRLVIELDPYVLDLANKAELGIDKKELLVSKGILAEKDKDIRRHVQKKLIDKMKAESREMSKWRANQEVHNLRSGNVYDKDERGKVFSHDHLIDPIDDDIAEHPSDDATTSSVEFKLDNSMDTLLWALTGQRRHNYDEKVVKNTKDYRLELFKKFRKGDLIRTYNEMLTVKVAVDETLRLLDKEIDAKEAAEKVLTK